MHEPQVVLFDVRLPFPRRNRWPSKTETERWTFGRWRRTNPENLGDPVLPWCRPAAWKPAIAGRRYQWRTFATVWHNEPSGHDSGTICKGMRGSDASLHNLAWAARHWRHLSVQVHPYQRVQQWLFARCDECGFRFLWKQSRHGYMNSDKVYHDKCMTVRALRSQLAGRASCVASTSSSDGAPGR